MHDPVLVGNRGLTVKILALQARDPGSTPGGCIFAPFFKKKTKRYPRIELGSPRPQRGVLSTKLVPRRLETSFSLQSYVRVAVVPKRLRGWTRNPLGSARAGSSPADCACVTRGGLAQWQSIGLVNRGSRVRSPQSPFIIHQSTRCGGRTHGH